MHQLFDIVYTYIYKYLSKYIFIYICKGKERNIILLLELRLLLVKADIVKLICTKINFILIHRNFSPRFTEQTSGNEDASSFVKVDAPKLFWGRRAKSPFDIRILGFAFNSLAFLYETVFSSRFIESVKIDLSRAHWRIFWAHSIF